MTHRLVCSAMTALMVGIPSGAGTLAAQTLGECPDEIRWQPSECGTFKVYEDRAAGTGRSIDLNIVVLRSNAESRTNDPLVLLAGGPGQGATAFASFAPMRYAKVLEERDILLIDQRGTGLSNPLVCPINSDNPQDYFGNVFGRERYRACADRLEQRANLALYTTEMAADDLDDVRAYLGYEQLNLSGGSYGTRAALIYLRRHPDRVRTVVLDGVAPTFFRAPRSYARDAQRALYRLLDDCVADSACVASFPNIRAEFTALVERLELGPVEATFINQQDTITVEMSRGDFGYAVRGMLYSVSRHRALPALIHRAYAENDFGPFAMMYYRRARGFEQARFADGMHISVFCAEDIPFTSRDQFDAFTAGTFLGDYLLQQYAGACDVWSRGDVASDYHDPVRSDVPVLLLSGWLDPVTPPRWGEEQAQSLSNSVHITVRYAGHGSSRFACGGQLVQDFIQQGSLEELDLSCQDESQPTAFVTMGGQE